MLYGLCPVAWLPEPRAQSLAPGEVAHVERQSNKLDKSH